jgi:hypothetical protein
MVALRLAPICLIPHEVSWSPILTAPEGTSFATHHGRRLLMIMSPLKETSISPVDFGHHHDALKHALHQLINGELTIQAWLGVAQQHHPMIEIAGVLIDQDQAQYFASNGAGVVMQRGGQVGLLCESSGGQISVSEGTINSQDRFMLASASLLTALQETDWSFMADYSFDQSKRHIEHALQTKTSLWLVGALGEAIASHAAQESKSEPTSKLASQLARFKERLSPHYPRLKSPKHRVSRVSLSVGMLLLVLLLVSMYLGSQQRLKRQKVEQFSAFVAPIEAQIAHAYAIRDANPLEAKRLVAVSKETFAQGKQPFELEPQFESKLDALSKTLDQATSEVIGISQATSLSPWHDLSLIKSGAQGSELATADNQLFVLDQVGGFVYGIAVSTKEAQVIAGSPELRASAHLAALGKRLVVVSQNRLLEISATQKTTAFLTEAMDANTAFTATAFWAGNVYVLDPATPTIWKYPGLTQGVGEAQSWLKDTSLVGSNAIDMAIDGDVWVLHDNGVVARIRQGARAGFGLEPLDTPLAQAAHLAISLENELMFVYDKAQHRIVEVTKTGKLVREYTLDDQLVVQDIAFSDAADELFILSGKELFALPRR